MRLATFNILHGRSLDDGLVDADRLADACASLGAHVLALQEVDRDQDRSGAVDLTAAVAERMGAAEWRFEPALVGVPGAGWRPAHHGEIVPGEPAYGVALVSCYPVREWTVVRLRPAPVRRSVPIRVPGSTRVIRLSDEPRVALAARLVTPYGELTVTSAHLSFVPFWNAWQLHRLVRELQQLPGPHVLLGDLNLVGRTPALVSGWTSLVTAKTFPSVHPRVQLDHALARGPLPGLRSAAAVQLPLSDHCAVVVEVGDAA